MNDARTYLQRLADELTRRKWKVWVGSGTKTTLRVENPDVPALHETIHCRSVNDGWSYCWPWREPIGPVDEVTGVADRIQHVLREVGS